jgi:uncharacterized protein (TIGR04255 family)
MPTIQERPKDLPRKPLVEAIVEVQWGSEGQSDPAYPIVVGRLFERVQPKYPEIEDLLAVAVPAELTVHIVRHRFRRSKGGWPLVQIGPGVFTFNETEGYRWDEFSAQAKALLPKLYEAHPTPDTFRPNSILLRYINALEFDYFSRDLLRLLADKLHTSLSLPEAVFSRTKVHSRPVGLKVQTAFPVEEPRGALTLQFASGTSKGKQALVWEIHVRSVGDDVPEMPAGFDAWLDAAHSVAEEWFFGLAEGELLDGFARS